MKPSLLLGLMLTTASMVTTSVAADSPIAVSIAVPQRGTERVLEYYGKSPHFHVIIANTSDKPQRIWREWCSWGYYGLSFEFTDASGETWTAKKKPRDWTKNYPDFWTVGAHESLVLDVQIANTDTWEGFPRPQGVSQTFTMRAVFEFRPDEESRQHSVWTGRIVSKSDKYVFYK
jgi:hypothetical protein